MPLASPHHFDLDSDEWLNRTLALHHARLEAILITEEIDCSELPDILQEVWIAALQYMYTADRAPEEIGPWLYRVGINKARDLIRARRRFKEFVAELAVSDRIWAEYREGDCVHADTAVAEALEKIDPEDAALLRAHFMEKLSFVEIAQLHGIDYHKVMYRKKLALAELRNVIPADVRFCD